jgi:hypothetical protein
MGNLTDLFNPLFRQSRYIHPNGFEVFESPALNIIKSPYVTGAFCGVFYQAAIGNPVISLLPIAVGWGVAQYLKSCDLDGSQQIKPAIIDKVIDKRPDHTTPTTSPETAQFAKELCEKARNLVILFSSMTAASIVLRIHSGDNPFHALYPMAVGLISDQTMRYMRFKQITNGHWVMHDKVPKQDELLLSSRPAIK